MPNQGTTAEIVLRRKFRKALYRITASPSLWVLCYFHKADRDVLRARRRRFPKDKKLRGVFSTHSPDRPNPLAMTRVKLLSCRGGVLRVQGLDAIDGTPVLDIKSAKDDILVFGEKRPFSRNP